MFPPSNKPSNITDSNGHLRNIHFPFDIGADTSISVATEMVAELDLTHQDVMVIAAMIDAEIHSHVSDWMEDSPEDLLVKPPVIERVAGTLTLERLPSGRIYWSDAPSGIPKKYHGDDNNNDDYGGGDDGYNEDDGDDL